MTDIATWAQSRFGFYVDRYWTGGRWVLERGPIRLAEYHADILRHCFTADGDGRLPYDVIGWCEPAKSGKSAIAGLAAEYAALHFDGDVILASNKRTQAASLMYRSLTDSVEFNPHLPRLQPGRLEVRFRNGNVAKAIASNSRSEAGARFSLVVFDELAGYVHVDAERLWSEFKTDPTRLNSVKLAIGYAGYMESKLWLEVLNRGLAGEPIPELAHITNADGSPTCWRNGRHFTFWSHVTRQPWQTEGWRDGLRKSLRDAQYRRMVLTEFVESVGDFVPLSAWEALIDPQHKPLPPGSARYIGAVDPLTGTARRRPVEVFIGLDLAHAPGGDDCALIGVYLDGGLVKLAFHRVWKGGQQRKTPLRLSRTVEPFILQAAKDYKLVGVWYDPYQALHLAESLSRAGVRCNPVSQTHATRGPKDTALYEAICSGRLVLYDHPEVRAMAASANAKELSNGLLFLSKSGRGKIDLLIALSNVFDEVGRQRRVVRSLR